MRKKINIRLAIGSILFGLIVFGKEMYSGGIWNWEGLLWVLYGAVGFGVLFSVLFGLIMKDFEKKENNKNLDNNKSEK